MAKIYGHLTVQTALNRAIFSKRALNGQMDSVLALLADVPGL